MKENGVITAARAGESSRKAPRRILVYGFKLSENFGGPSVLHGFREAVARLWPDAEIVCYQPAGVDPVSVSDMDFPVREYPYGTHVRDGKSVKEFVRDWLKVKFLGRCPSDGARRAFWTDYAAADAVVNIYAICFCDNWGASPRKDSSGRASLKRCLKADLVTFLPNLVARIDRKISVKTAASYGAILTDECRRKARWAAKWFFARLTARENESARQMRDEAGVRKRIPVSPDLANLMPAGDAARVPGLVGISTSFQMERKWDGPDGDYLSCMRALVDHVRQKYGCTVRLLPNQLNGPDGRGDDKVADDLLDGLSGRADVEIFDTRSAGALALKRAVAECDVVVSPRYHTCVAALSSGVPLLTVGWHYKYTELMELYGQSEFVMPSGECSVAHLLSVFDRLWTERERVRSVLKDRKAAVQDAVLASVADLMEG